MKRLKILTMTIGLTVVALGFQNCGDGFKTAKDGLDDATKAAQAAGTAILSTQSVAITKTVSCPAAESVKNTPAGASAALQACIGKMASGEALELSPGIYNLDRGLRISRPGITIKTAGKALTDPTCLDSSTDCAELKATANYDLDNRSLFYLIYSEVADVHLDHLIVNGNKEARAPNQLTHRTLNISMFGDRNTLSNSISKNSLISSALQFPAFGGRSLKGVRAINNRFTDNGLHDFIPNSNEAAWSDGLILALATDAQIVGNYFAYNTDVDLITWGCKNCTITDNIFRHGELRKSSFGALNIAVAVDGPGSADYAPESGIYTGTEVSRNDIDCGPQKACGYGIIVGVFQPYLVGAVRAVTGVKVVDNKVANAQQGISIHHATGVRFANNSVTGSGIKDQVFSCKDGATSYQWSGLNISSSYASNIDRSGDPLASMHVTNFDDPCLPNAAMRQRSGTRDLTVGGTATNSSTSTGSPTGSGTPSGTGTPSTTTTAAQLREQRINAIRGLSNKHLGQISTNNAAVEAQIAFLANGGSLAALESLFVLVKNTWNQIHGSLPTYAYVDAGMNGLLGGVTATSYQNLVKIESDKIKGVQAASLAACKDLMVVPGSWDSTPMAGVSTAVSQMYYEVLGGIGAYSAGAKYITGLAAQGYALQSLRNDVIKDIAVRNELNKVYQTYLARNVADADFNNVKVYLQTPGNSLRKLELSILNSQECKLRKQAGLEL